MEDQTLDTHASILEQLQRIFAPGARRNSEQGLKRDLLATKWQFQRTLSFSVAKRLLLWLYILPFRFFICWKSSFREFPSHQKALYLVLEANRRAAEEEMGRRKKALRYYVFSTYSWVSLEHPDFDRILAASKEDALVQFSHALRKRLHIEGKELEAFVERESANGRIEIAPVAILGIHREEDGSISQDPSEAWFLTVFGVMGIENVLRNSKEK